MLFSDRRTAYLRALAPAHRAPCKLQISIMKMVKHDHIVKLYEVLASRTKVGFVGVGPHPFLRFGSVSMSVRRRVRNLPAPRAWHSSRPGVQIFIVLELITGGELFDKIVAEGKCVGGWEGDGRPAPW